MDKYLGKRLDGRYEIHRIDRRWGMANVYKAWDVIENRVVAVKILRRKYLDNEEFLRRFKMNPKPLRSLSHPNNSGKGVRCQLLRPDAVHCHGVHRWHHLKEYIEQQAP